MVQIELVPDLFNCIETVAKREHQDLVRRYFLDGKSDSEFEEKIETLRMFLESADFRKLRRESEGYLLEGQSIKFVLYQEQGETKYKLVCC